MSKTHLDEAKLTMIHNVKAKKNQILKNNSKLAKNSKKTMKKKNKIQTKEFDTNVVKNKSYLNSSLNKETCQIGEERVMSNKILEKPKKNLKRKFVKDENKQNLKKIRQTQGKQYESRNFKIKSKLFHLKKSERKLIRKKQKVKTESFERSKKLKYLWEEIRKEDCKLERRNELLEQVFKLINGYVKELSFAHDTVRVLECIFGHGNEIQKMMIYNELKDCILTLTKSKYGKYLIIKILRSGSKEQKNEIISQFYSNVISLLSHSEASDVIEVAFNECASAIQRNQLVQEFYGPSFKYFKESSTSLKQLSKNEFDKMPSIIQHMKEALVKLLQKSIIKHSIVHYILREFLAHSTLQLKHEVIETVAPVLVEMLHTRDGARATMHCVWNGTAKDRKVIIKSFKGHVAKISQEEYGHLVLLSIFDSVDDTKLVEKIIITELLSDVSAIMENLYGKKVFLYLISPRDSVYFCPKIIEILSEGDSNETSKKDSEKRKSELKIMVMSALVNYVSMHVSEKYKDNSFCLSTFTILKQASDYRHEAFYSISKLAAIPYSSDLKDVHIIESPGSNFMLKKLIMEDNKNSNQESFSIILIKALSKDVIKSWTNCNRGCFLLVTLLETEISFVVQIIEDALYGYHTELSKKLFTGSSILLKKIQH